MALEIRGGQDQARNSDYTLKSDTEPPHREESLNLKGSNKITPDFPITSACCNGQTMTSQEPLSGDSGSIKAACADQEIAQGVQTLKALSLNGLNPNLCHSTSASDDSQSMPLGGAGRPHPIISWGNVTEIPNGATAKTHEYVKHPIAGSSSSSEPWQVRSTQNPSRPLVRRPTPMAIRVPVSVLGKGSAKMMSESFEEEDEEQVTGDGDESPIPVSLKQGTNMDILVIEDVDESDIDSPSPGLSAPKYLPLSLVVEGHTIQRGSDVGSPTIVVRTDIGEELSHEEAEQLEDAEEDEDEEEEDDFDVEDKQFLSPTASKSFGKNPEPPASNSHIQAVPHQPRKFVRRQTPITLDLPKNLKDIMATTTSEGIMEEEEEEEEEEDNQEMSEKEQHRLDTIQPINNQVDDSEAPNGGTKPLGSPEETEKTVVASPVTIGEEISDDNDIQKGVSGRPDILNSVNCNNNNREAASMDLVEGAQDTVKSQVGTAFKEDNQQRKSQFKKSATSAIKDGSGSPSSARRKVSQHHTKILKRRLTPLEIEVPKNVISDAMKKRSADSFLEEGDEDES